MSAFGSVSFASTAIVAVVSSGVVATSLVGVGGAFTGGRTVISIVPVADKMPSLTLNVTESEPVNPAAGV